MMPDAVSKKTVLSFERVDNLTPALRACVHEFSESTVNACLSAGVRDPNRIRQLIKDIWEGARQPTQRRQTLGTLDWVLIQAGWSTPACAPSRISTFGAQRRKSIGFASARRSGRGLNTSGPIFCELHLDHMEQITYAGNYSIRIAPAGTIPSGRFAFQQEEAMQPYGLSGQGQAGLGALYAAQANVAIPQPVAPTLTRALSRIDDLNKRLAQLAAGTQAIAQQIGGPFPVRGTADDAKAAAPQSAMESLNGKIDSAHSWVSDIEGAQDAIRRSLGG